jgi:geranylgeranyl reductase family protein
MVFSGSYDILIVGAGPAGSTLGYLLAERGLDVLVIDRAHFPRPKLCGGALTWKTRKLLEEIYKIPFAEQFSAESASEDYAIYEKYRLKIFQSSPEPFDFISREKYDATLVTLAQERGCHFQFGQQITEIDYKAGEIYTRENNIFTGKIIVGADGVNSVVRARLLPDLDFHRNSGVAFQLSIPPDKIKKEYRAPVPRSFLGGVSCGYGWIFPQGEQFVVGLWGLVKKNKNVKEKYLDFLDKVTEIDVEKLAHLPSHLGPAGNFMETPGKENVLLIGDAAGFADPLTGEGIYYAHKSAACAAEAICNYFESDETSMLLKSYSSCLIPIIKELKIALRFRNLFYSNLRYLAYFFFRDPKLFFKLASVIHGTKSYSRLPIISKLM